MIVHCEVMIAEHASTLTEACFVEIAFYQIDENLFSRGKTHITHYIILYTYDDVISTRKSCFLWEYVKRRVYKVVFD